MRTTITLDDDLLERAQQLTGIEERPPWCARRLARLKGYDPKAEAAPRRRPGV